MKRFLPLSLCAMLFLAASMEAQTIKPESLHIEGIENVFKVTEKVYSGSSPETEAAFGDLQKRGIKTIVSVDGAKPDVELARKYGMRYVHLPIGYDGVPANRVMELAKVGTDLPKPIFIHCHHGKHRGPAGAAMICMGAEGWTPDEGLKWIKQAGTATNYAGLYQSVRDFKVPSKDALAKVSNLPEKMEVSPLVDAMVEIDERFENLKLVKVAGYKQPPSHPDISPAHEALLLHELFKELVRSPETKKHDQNYQTKLAEGEQYTGKLHAVLADSSAFSVDHANAAFQKISENCAACHKAHRN